MHIVQLANFHGPRSGGIKVALDELAMRYVAAGHRCTLVIPGDTTEVEGPPERRVHRIEAPVVPRLGGYRLILDRAVVRNVLANDPPDVIELSDKTTLLGVCRVPRLAGVPVVLISHERLDAVIPGVMGTNRALAAGVRRFNRRVLSRVDAVVAASDFAASEFRGIGDVPICQVPLGVDLDCFHPVTRPERDGVLHLVAVVRLSPEKQPGLLVEAVADLVRRGAAVHLDVLGDGPMRTALETEAVGLPITFHGHVPDRMRVATFLASADVAVAPGPSETFGLAALEALATGTPVVVPSGGALKELVSHGVGRVAESTGAEFARAILDVSQWPGAATRQRARRHAERFTWERSSGLMLNVFNELRAARAAAA